MLAERSFRRRTTQNFDNAFLKDLIYRRDRFRLLRYNDHIYPASLGQVKSGSHRVLACRVVAPRLGSLGGGKMRDPQRPKTKKELLEPWAQHQTRQYDAVCSEEAALKKRLLELEPEKTKILQFFHTSGVDIEENIDELGRWLTLPTRESIIAGEVKLWLQRPSRRPKGTIPDLAGEFPIEVANFSSVNVLVAIQRITWRKAQLEKKRKVFEVRLRQAGFPIPGEEPRPEASVKRFRPSTHGGVELCKAVSYQKAGRRDLRKLALFLKNKAQVRYEGKRYKYKDPLDWYESCRKGFTDHLYNLRRKAKCQGWYKDIPTDY